MKKLLIIILLQAFTFSIFAQDVYTSSGRSANAKKKQEKKGFDPSRLIIGGGLGLAFGNVTNISVSPIVGYRLTERLAAGVGLGYQYVRIKDYWVITDLQTAQDRFYPYKASIYSASVWTRFVVWNNLFLHAEYEHNFMSFKEYDYDYNVSYPYPIVDKNVNYNAPSVLLGAGYRAPVSPRASFTVMALYDVLQDKYSPYQNSIFFRFGFNVGF